MTNNYSCLYDTPTRISLKCAGSYAVSEIYNGLKHAIDKSRHTLTDISPQVSIMIRGILVPIPPKPNILILTDEPYEVNKTCRMSSSYNLVFTNEQTTLIRHPGSVYLPLAYDHNLKPKPTPKLYDICHVGGGYPGRRDYIIPAMRKFKNSILVGPKWPRTTKKQLNIVTFDEHIDLYRKSRIVLNIHRNNIYSAFGRLNTQNHRATHLAPRVWNCAAVGSFQIIDAQRDNSLIPSLVKATTPLELIQKCEYYLDNEDELNNLAKQQRKEVKKHSWLYRLGFILSTANKNGLIP